jgi:adenylate cyclase
MSDKLKTEGDRVKRTLKFVQILLDISNDLASSDSLDDALEKLVAITTKTIGAERGTIFLNDKRTDELYSRFLKNSLPYEIRIENNLGIAGWVFTNGDSSIINDAYADERFNKNIDKKTGFKTRNILCTPIRTTKGELIGVSQILNKNDGPGIHCHSEKPYY